jgi:hypothetical protein
MSRRSARFVNRFPIHWLLAWLMFAARSPLAVARECEDTAETLRRVYRRTETR